MGANKSKAYIFMSIFFIPLAILSYRWIQDLIFSAGYIVVYIFGADADYFLLNNGFMLDSLSCIVQMLIYSLIYLLLNLSKGEGKLSVSDIGICVIITFGMSGVSTLWLYFADYLSGSISFIADSLESFTDTWNNLEEESYIWILLSVAILGPIVEELLFRGIVFRLARNIRRGYFPIIISALLFGLWHEEPVQIVYTFLMGIVLAMVYDKTKSLFYPILMHVLNNFLSTLPPKLDTDNVVNTITYLSMILILPTLYAVYRMVRNQRLFNSGVNTGDI